MSRNKNALPLTFGWSLCASAQTHIFTLTGTGTHAYVHWNTHAHAHTNTHTPSELPTGTNTTCHFLIFNMQIIMIATISGALRPSYCAKGTQHAFHFYSNTLK